MLNIGYCSLGHEKTNCHQHFFQLDVPLQQLIGFVFYFFLAAYKEGHPDVTILHRTDKPLGWGCCSQT